jgi:hypothetical protein
MAKLSDQELRALIAESAPDAFLVQDDGSSPTTPSSVRQVADRAQLAKKLASRHGLDARPKFAPPPSPPPLVAGQSKFGGHTVEGPRGRLRTNATVYSAETAEPIIEQG